MEVGGGYKLGPLLSNILLNNHTSTQCFMGGSFSLKKEFQEKFSQNLHDLIFSNSLYYKDCIDLTFHTLPCTAKINASCKL